MKTFGDLVNTRDRTTDLRKFNRNIVASDEITECAIEVAMDPKNMINYNGGKSWQNIWIADQKLYSMEDGDYIRQIYFI